MRLRAALVGMEEKDHREKTGARGDDSKEENPGAAYVLHLHLDAVP